MSFRLKTIIGIAVIEGILLLIIIWSSVAYLKESSDAALTQRSQSVATLFATAATDAVLATDLASLESVTAKILDNPGVIYARIRDERDVLAQQGEVQALQREFKKDVSLDEVDDGVFDAVAHISVGDIEFARAEVGIAVAPIQELISHARQRISSIALLEMLLVALFSYALGVYLTGNLKRLGSAARRIADGEEGVTVAISGRDELAETAHAFNVMSEKLDAAQKRLHRNLEEARRSTESYRQARTYLEAVIDHAGEGIITLDDKGGIESVNPAVERILGYREDELVGKNITTLIHSSESLSHDQDLTSDITNRTASVIELSGEIWGKLRSGKQIPLDLSISEMRLEKELRFVAILRDISTRHETKETLRIAKERAEEANRAKSAFVATMSHEIRTPLSAIMGTVGLLLDSPLSAEQRRLAQTAHDAGQVLLSIVEDVLDFSKIEAGHIELEAASFRLTDIVEGVAELLAPKAQDKGIAIACCVDLSIPERVIGDASRLRQILVNLVGNAVKFTHQGGIFISVRRKSTAGSRVELRFEVVDSGIGIPLEQQSRLFQEFTQAELADRQRYGGTGLGLAISRRLVELMGGAIDVASRPDEGSTFYFTAQFEWAPESTPPGYRVLPDLHCLIATEEAPTARALTQTLRQVGASVTVEPSTTQALERLQNASQGERPYRIVIVDAPAEHSEPGQFPNLAKAALKSSSGSIFLMTRSLTAFAPEESRQVGYFALLRKPIRRRSLFTWLGRALNESSWIDEGLAQPRIQGPVSKSDRQGRRILVVEDTVPNQLVATAILERAGYSVDIASNGLEAISAVESEHYDCILMDLRMPKMNGLEATRRIRALERGANVPIVALTADAVRSELDQCIAAGMDDHLTKPIEASELVAKVDHWRRQRDESSTPLADAVDAVDAVRTDGGDEAATVTASKEIQSTTRVIDLSALEVLRKEVGDDYATKLLGRYLSEARERQQILIQAEAQADWKQIRELAHIIRGSSGYVGAFELSAAAGRLEDAIKQGTDEPQRLVSLLKQFNDLFDASVRELERVG